MTKYEELMSKTKAQLKDLITKESSQEEINKITSIDKSLDELQADAIVDEEEEEPVTE